MPSKTRLAVSLVALLTVCTAIAADDPIAQRRTIMKNNYKAETAANSVILGKYLVPKAIAALQKLEDNMTVFLTLFPEGSDKGETHALLAIWTNMEDFRALAAKLVADAKAAEAATVNGQDAFTLAFQEVSKDCAVCHEKYTTTLYSP
jgi:cytochrome c556